MSKKLKSMSVPGGLKEMERNFLWKTAVGSGREDIITSSTGYDYTYHLVEPQFPHPQNAF